MNHGDHRHDLGWIGGEIHFDNLLQFLGEIFNHALVITVFVIMMMLLIEYLTIQSRGRMNRSMQQNPLLQILIASILGLAPGCLGVYMVVSLYVHRVIHFAALTAAMIATSGDEIFVMFAMIPGKTPVLLLIMLGIAISAGLLLYLFPLGKHQMSLDKNHMEIHNHDPDCRCFIPSEIPGQLRRISFERAILVAGGIVFLILLISGDLGPPDWNWQRIIFVGVTLIELFIALTVPDHFLTKHFWGHVIRRHFLRVFAWTFGAFLVIHAGLEFLHLEEMITGNLMLILVIAVLVGIIPESGPHIVFITLFAAGAIPLSILLANSIVQDGHGSLPLLAETRRDFLRMKAVNLVVGLVVGLALLGMGF